MEEKEEVINSYMKFRAIECKNKDALVNYERYLRRFLKGADNKLSNLDETYLIDKVNNFSDDFSQTTINVIKPLLKNFIKWKYVDYPVKFRNLDKICRTKRAKATYSAKQMLKESEVKKIIKTETDLFWKVFWMVFFYGGMRGIDTIRLKWDMFDFSQKDDIIIIKTFIGKNKKEFYKGLPAELTPIIKKWKDVNPSEWVFPSPQGDHPIHPKTPNKRLERVSKKALGKSINPYILRHSLGSIKYNEDGIDKDIIADQMGHSIDMSGVYTHLNEDEMVARAKKVWTNKKEMPKKERDALLKRIETLEKSNKEMRQSSEDFLKEIKEQHYIESKEKIKELAKHIK
jgi:integrase